MSGINLLAEISSGARFEILQLLKENPLKSSQIAKEMDSSIQAISRHLDRLNDSKLIEKTIDGKYQLSSIAKVSLTQLPFFEFLGKNKDYFQTHDFKGIPDHLLARIGDLAQCKFEPDFMKALQKARDFCSDAEKFLYGATCTMPLEVFDIVLEKTDPNFEFRNVFGTNSVVPIGFYDYPSRKQFEKLHDSSFEEKIVQEIPINTVVSDKACILLFSNKELGQIDAKGIFFGTDEKSIGWCRDLVDYYFKMESIDNFRLKEQ